MAPKILIAEDHEAARELIRHALDGLGFELEFADTGPAAWAALEKRAFDTALLDLALPGLTGSEICRRLKSDPHRTGLPVVLMSGALGARELADEARAVGADAHLAKPFSLGELRTVAQAFTKIHRQGTEIARLRREVEENKISKDESVRLDWDLPYHEFMKLARKKYFVHALELAGGNKSRLARRSGLDRSTLYVHFRNLGMIPTRKKAASGQSSPGSGSERDQSEVRRGRPWAGRGH